MRFRLTNEVVFKLTHQDNLSIRQEISDVYNVGVEAVNRWVKNNEYNSDLTGEAAQIIISEGLRMSREDILEREQPVEVE